MTYQVAVDVRSPEETEEADPLKCVGAVAVIREAFGPIGIVTDPAGVRVELVDGVAALHPGRALLRVRVDAPTPKSAEAAAHAAVGGLLTRAELLTGWRIGRCRAGSFPRRTRQGGDVAKAVRLPSAGPAADEAPHERPLTGTRARAGDDSELRAREVRDEMVALAGELRSFPPDVFGVGADEGDRSAGDRSRPSVLPRDATLAAGAVVYAIDILVNQLCDDMHALTRTGGTVGDQAGRPWSLGDLPVRYVRSYDARFARRFLVTAVALTTRMTDGSHLGLGCVAEVHAFRLLLCETSRILNTYGLLDDGVSAALDAFTAHVRGAPADRGTCDDTKGGPDTSGSPADPWGTPGPGTGEWFAAFDEDGYVHPCAADEAVEADAADGAAESRQAAAASPPPSPAPPNRPERTFGTPS